MNWKKLSEQVLDGYEVTTEEALAILDAPDEEVLSLVEGAFTLRKAAFGMAVSVHVLQNAKSGMCRENCKFCSQAIGSYSGVDRYQVQEVDELVAGAYSAHARNAVKYCMVTATRGPSDKELDTICTATRRIKEKLDIDICCSLGLLNQAQANELAEAGVDRFNHNLETSERYYKKVCNTHTFQDRLNTLKYVREAGMEICCGGIMGMGETARDRVELALILREVRSESIPVNFLDPREGTPLGDVEKLTPNECLKALCMFRYTNPKADIRAAGGREVCLKQLQPFALYVANSVFTEGYLTTPGQGENKDLQMIEDGGFHVSDYNTKEHLGKEVSQASAGCCGSSVVASESSCCETAADAEVTSCCGGAKEASACCGETAAPETHS